MSYREMIMKDTGCTATDAPMVEEIMRQDVFHSTLDWQTRAELRRGARLAYQVLNKNRAEFDEYRQKALAAVNGSRGAGNGSPCGW